MTRCAKLFLTLWGLVWLGTSASSLARAGYAVEIDLSDQRAFLLYEGQVVLETPISSGRRGYDTPTGRFRILDKNIDHRSSLYGKIVDARGRTVVADADAGMEVPAGGKFVNAPMPYFMRFHGGIGMHAGILPGYAASHGCVRLPEENAAEFFHAVDVGTPVTVFGSAPIPRARVVQTREERLIEEREIRRRESREDRVFFRPFRWRSWARD